VSLRSLQNSPLESSCVVDALIETYNTSKPLKVYPEKSQILSCDTVVAIERYVYQERKSERTLFYLENFQCTVELADTSRNRL
jgi:hypothetical protein